MNIYSTDKPIDFSSEEHSGHFCHIYCPICRERTALIYDNKYDEGNIKKHYIRCNECKVRFYYDAGTMVKAVKKHGVRDGAPT